MCQEEKVERELIRTDDYLDAQVKELKDYIKKSKERLITTTNCISYNGRTDRKTTKTS